jgi:tRNA pseudouridine65 synthase
MFEERFGLNTMLLHASELSFIHPITGANVHISAPMSDEFTRILTEIGML